MKHTHLNEKAQVGPVFVFVFAVICIGLFYFVFTPIVDEINGMQADQIADGSPVSVARIDVMNNINLIWGGLFIILLIIAVVWLWVASMRRESGGI